MNEINKNWAHEVAFMRDFNTDVIVADLQTTVTLLDERARLAEEKLDALMALLSSAGIIP